MPAFGLCEITLPAWTSLEKAWSVFPAEQECALSARFAARRVSPFMFGTTQFLNVNLAVAGESPGDLELALGPAVTRADQPAKLEPRAGFAFSVTDVPNRNLCEHVFGQ